MYFPQVWADTSHRQFAQQKLKKHKLFAEEKAKNSPALRKSELDKTVQD